MKVLPTMFAAGLLAASLAPAQAATVTSTVNDFCNIAATPCPGGSFDITLATPAAALGNGTLTLELFGDFNDSLEFVSVNIEGTDFGNIFNNNIGDDLFNLNPDTGNQYASSITVSAMINNLLLTSLINDGQFTLSFTLSGAGQANTQDDVNDLFDDGPNTRGEFITATLEFDEVTTRIPAPVPVPAAVWLFGSALLGLIGMKKKKV